MKQKIKSAIVIAVTLLCSFGCKKSTDNTNYNMYATIGGSQFWVSNCISKQTGTGLDITGFSGVEDAYGNPTTLPYIFLQIDGYNGVGTYNFNSITYNTGGFIRVDSGNGYKIAVHGMINITSVSPNIQGFFDFMCNDSTFVNGGSFVAKHY